MAEYEHARLAQLCREIEACCKRLGSKPTEADAERWADENSVIWPTGEKPLPDILKAARLYCQLRNLDQTSGFDLIGLGDRVCQLVDMRPIAVVAVSTAVFALQLEARDIADEIEAEMTVPGEPQSNGAPKAEKPKGKPGRPRSDSEEDTTIYNEYYDGKEEGLWESQAEYVRQKHPHRTAAWFTYLLKRVEQPQKN